MSRPPNPCEICGDPAIVHITNEEPEGMSVRHLCLRCAGSERRIVASSDRGLNRSALLIWVGLILLVISVFADQLAFGKPGFGWKQETGVVLAAILVFIGSVVRIPTISVTGLLAGLLTTVADYVGFGNAEGFGYQQMAGAVVGVVLIGLGLHAQRWRRLSSPR